MCCVVCCLSVSCVFDLRCLFVVIVLVVYIVVLLFALLSLMYVTYTCPLFIILIVVNVTNMFLLLFYVILLFGPLARAWGTTPGTSRILWADALKLSPRFIDLLNC